MRPAAASGTVDASNGFLPERPVSPFRGPFHLLIGPGPVCDVHLLLRVRQMRLERGDGSGVNQKWTPTVHGDGGAPLESDAATDATLDELGRKLSDLRRHLEQVVAGLNGLHDDGRESRDAARPASTGRSSGPSGMPIGLRCHACGRVRSTDQIGWTLRLCGDDVLHLFCPDCDHRYVNGDRRVQPGPGPRDTPDGR